MMRGLITTCTFFFLLCTISAPAADLTNELMEASAFGNGELVQQLIASGADVNARDNKDCPPIIMAARSGNVETIKILLNSGADINARDMYEMTPLMHASLSGNADAVKYLVSRGADVHAKARNGKTAFDWSPNKSITRHLKNHEKINGKNN